MLSRSEHRANIRISRKALTEEQQQQASAQLFSQLTNLESVQRATNIAIYLASDGEVDALPFIHWCWQQQKSVYLPVIHPFSKGHLLFLKYDDNTEMHQNKYGIWEPKLNVMNIISPESIDIIFTPLVAFDDKGNRLGMGGGFYDRTLANWYQQFQAVKVSPTMNQKALSAIKPMPIGLAHDLQQVSSLPCEHWDIPLPTIVTPSNVFSFN